MLLIIGALSPWRNVAGGGFEQFGEAAKNCVKPMCFTQSGFIAGSGYAWAMLTLGMVVIITAAAAWRSGLGYVFAVDAVAALVVGVITERTWAEFHAHQLLAVPNSIVAHAVRYGYRFEIVGGATPLVAAIVGMPGLRFSRSRPSLVPTHAPV